MAAAIVLLISTTSISAGTREPIDTDHSTITVRVGKTGMFRAFGDDHEIRGIVQQGFVDEGVPAVDVVVDARELRVLDPRLSPERRDEVQLRMLGADVLDVARFPEIRFTSEQATETGSGWTVRGELRLHGQTRTVTTTVERQRNHYRGTLHVRQTDFGITPIVAAGGAVKVKDDVTIEFDIVAKGASATQSGS